MHYTNPLILLGLATAASAIDIQTWWRCNGCPTPCSGVFLSCQGINPGRCCSVPNGIVSADDIGFHYMPTDWRLELFATSDRDCNTYADGSTSRGRTSVCLKNGPQKYAGIYFFENRRNADVEPGNATRALYGECEGTQQANVLGLADGTEYDIAGLENAAVLELFNAARDGANATDLARFESRRLPASVGA